MADTMYQYLSVVAKDFIFFSGDVQTATIALAIASSLCYSVVWAIYQVVTMVQNSNGCKDKRRTLSNSSWSHTSTKLERIRGKLKSNSENHQMSDEDLDDLFNQQVEVPCVRCNDFFADPNCRFVTCKLCCFSKSACFFHQNNKHVKRRRCKLSSRVTQLDLSKCHIAQCPDRIGYVGAQLTHLNLSNNNLSELPSEIGCLRGLEELLVTDNAVKDIPESLCTLTNLKILKLGNNNIQMLPDFISCLTNLEQLDVSHNSLLLLPPTIGDLRNLQTLHAGNNKLEEIPSGLYNLQHLKVLDISTNPLQSIQDNIKHLSQLEELNISSCDLETFPEGVCYCSSLVTLHISYNRIEKLPVQIGLLSHLEHLHLIQNKLTYLPANLDINRLRTFNVSENPLVTSSFCDKATIDSLTVKQDSVRFPSLLEMCARCISSNESKLADRSVLPQSLIEMLQTKEYCTRCGGPFFIFYESRVDFIQHSEGNLPFLTEICTPHKPYCY